MLNIPGPVNNTMHEDGLWADRVENQMITDNNKTIPHGGELFIIGDFSKVGMGREAFKVFFDRRRESIGGGRTVGRDIGNDSIEILLGNREETNRVFTRTHQFAFGGLASPGSRDVPSGQPPPGLGLP